MPVQVNGKVRARLTVPADISEERAARAGARRSAGRPHTRRQDGPEGRDRRRRSPLVSIVVSLMMPIAVISCSAASRHVALPAVRLLAGRPRLVPAGLHQDASASRCSPTRRASSTSSSRVTDKVRAELIGRGR